MKTKGAELVAQLCRDKITQSELARRLDIPRQAVVAWIRGEYKPSLERMLALEKEFGIPIKKWTVEA